MGGVLVTLLSRGLATRIQKSIFLLGRTYAMGFAWQPCTPHFLMGGKLALRHLHPREAPLFPRFFVSMGGLPSPPLLLLVIMGGIGGLPSPPHLLLIIMGGLQSLPIILIIIMGGLHSPPLPLGL